MAKVWHGVNEPADQVDFVDQVEGVGAVESTSSTSSTPSAVASRCGLRQPGKVVVRTLHILVPDILVIPSSAAVTG